MLLPSPSLCPKFVPPRNQCRTVYCGRLRCAPVEPPPLLKHANRWGLEPSDSQGSNCKTRKQVRRIRRRTYLVLQDSPQ